MNDCLCKNDDARWVQRSDGHLRYWWECVTCGGIASIAPWLLTRKEK